MRKFTLVHDLSRCRAIEEIRRAENGSVVTITDGPVRNLDQNARLHSAITDISKQVEHMGQTFSVTVWKRLLTAAYLREKGEQPTLVPAIDGHGVDIIYEKTSQMSKQMMSELIEFTYAFGSEKGVVWSERVRAA